MIPNNNVDGDFIGETKKLHISNGDNWNDNLFAIRFLLSNMNEIKIISEKIHFI